MATKKIIVPPIPPIDGLEIEVEHDPKANGNDRIYIHIHQRGQKKWQLFFTKGSPQNMWLTFKKLP